MSRIYIKQQGETVDSFSPVINKVNVDSIGGIPASEYATKEYVDNKTSEGTANGSTLFVGTTEEFEALTEEEIANIETFICTDEDVVDLDSFVTHGELQTIVSNPNLLINGDFRINQRNGYYAPSGITYYSDTALSTSVSTLSTNITVAYVDSTYCSVAVDGTTYYVATSDCIMGYVDVGYGFDMWRKTANTFVVTKLDNGINYTDITENRNTFQYRVEDWQNLRGKTVTLSAKVTFNSNSTFRIVINDGTVNVSTSNESGLMTLTKTISETATQLIISVGSDSGVSNVDIEYIKLELGSVATPFSPRPYAEELALCQRYLIGGLVLRGYAVYSKKYVVFPLPLPLRRNTSSYTLINSESYQLFVNGTDVTTNVTAMGISTYQGEPEISLTYPASNYSDQFLLVMNNSLVSAEL